MHPIIKNPAINHASPRNFQPRLCIKITKRKQPWTLETNTAKRKSLLLQEQTRFTDRNSHEECNRVQRLRLSAYKHNSATYKQIQSKKNVTFKPWPKAWCIPEDEIFASSSLPQMRFLILCLASTNPKPSCCPKFPEPTPLKLTAFLLIRRKSSSLFYHSFSVAVFLLSSAAHSLSFPF